MTLGSAEFRGASRDSVTDLRDQLAGTTPGDATPGDATPGEELGPELFGVAGVLDAQPTLRRALTDPSRDGSDRVGLATAVFGGRVGSATLEVVISAVRRSWSRVRDLGDALEYLGAFVEVLGAERSGSLDDLEDELFRFGRIVESDPKLRAALGDSTVPGTYRADLAENLLRDKVNAVTLRLVRQAVTTPRGRDLLAALESYAEIAAAWRERLVAVVRTAVALDEAQQERLRAVLARLYGRDVDLNLLIDEELVGGLRIEVGDDVIDGSVLARLDQARRKLAGELSVRDVNRSNND